MANIFYISDNHFDHANILTFRDGNGNFIRPGFVNVEEMNELMVQHWNEVVRPDDHVYHVGDIAMKKSGLRYVSRLNGHKRITPGNHDSHFRVEELQAAGFEKVFGVRVIDNYVVCHFPIHPSNMARFAGNIHGHIHQNPSPAGAYLNVSVERWNYYPIAHEVAKQLIAAKVEQERAREEEELRAQKEFRAAPSCMRCGQGFCGPGCC